MTERAQGLVEAVERLLDAARDLDAMTPEGPVPPDVALLESHAVALANATEAALGLRKGVRASQEDTELARAGRKAVAAASGPGVEPYPDMRRLRVRITEAGWEDSVTRDLLLGLGSHLSLLGRPDYLEAIDDALSAESPPPPAPR